MPPANQPPLPPSPHIFASGVNNVGVKASISLLHLIFHLLHVSPSLHPLHPAYCFRLLSTLHQLDGTARILKKGTFRFAWNSAEALVASKYAHSFWHNISTIDNRHRFQGIITQYNNMPVKRKATDSMVPTLGSGRWQG